MARPEAHSLPALAPSAGGRALRQRRPSSGNHSIHRRQFAGLQRLQQQQRRGNDFSSAEARRDDELVVAASSSSGAAAAAAASSWPAAAEVVSLCQDKGQSEEDCHNYIRVLHVQGNVT